MTSKVCSLSMVPMRKEPNHRSEMVSQILLGETALEIDTEKTWVRIRMDFDKYEGWVEKNSLEDFTSLSDTKKEIVKTTFLPAELNGGRVYLPAGSELEITSNRDMFSVANNYYGIANSAQILKNSGTLIHTAKQFLHAPYLWGGRTAMGIDCSGFMQLVFKIHGAVLARDASDQVAQGSTIRSLSKAKCHDLMFFNNPEGKITHVGLYLGEGTIIHASKLVRIDSVDKKGIFNGELEEYTHFLHSIRRIQTDTDKFK